MATMQDPKRLMRDYATLVSGADSHFAGQVLVRTDENGDDLRNVVVEMKPTGGPYRGGTFVFTMSIPDDYPTSPPAVMCNTPVYHPNIDCTHDQSENEDCGGTNVCVSLFDEWEKNYALVDAVQAVLFLFYEPNMGDALSTYFGGNDYDDDELAEFEATVRKTLLGETVEDGITFERNFDDRFEDDVIGRDVDRRGEESGVDVFRTTDVVASVPDKTNSVIENDVTTDVPNVANDVTTAVSAATNDAGYDNVTGNADTATDDVTIAKNDVDSQLLIVATRDDSNKKKIRNAFHYNIQIMKFLVKFSRKFVDVFFAFRTFVTNSDSTPEVT